MNKVLISMFRQELEKKPEQPFMMYIAFDDLQVLIHQIGLCFFTIFPTNIAGATASGGEVEGSLPLPGETLVLSGGRRKSISNLSLSRLALTAFVIC